MSNIKNWADENSSSDEEDNNIHNTTNIEHNDKINTDNVSFSASVDDIGNFFAGGGCKVKDVRSMKIKGKFEVILEDEESYQKAFDANGYIFMNRSLQVFDKKDFYDKKPIRNNDQDDKWNNVRSQIPVDNKPKKILEKPKDIAPVPTETAPSVRPVLVIQPRTKPLEEIGKVEKAASIFGEGKPRVEKLVESVTPVTVSIDGIKSELKVEEPVIEESSKVSTTNEPVDSNTKVDNKYNATSKAYTNNNRDNNRRSNDRTTTGRNSHRTVSIQPTNRPSDTSSNVIDQSEKEVSVNVLSTNVSTDTNNKPYRERGGRFSGGRDGGRKSVRESDRPNNDRSEAVRDSSDRYTDRGGRQSSREGGRYTTRDGGRATTGRQSAREGSNRYSDNKSGRGGRGNDYQSRSQPLDDKQANGKVDEVTNDKKTLIDKKPIKTDEIKSTQQKPVLKSVNRTTVFDKTISNVKNSFGALDSEDDD
eukprot:gene20682-26815_t